MDYRNAVTGEYVTEEFAQANPDTTVSERDYQHRQQKPSVGRKVHYVSYGTPKGEFSSMCRSAEITEVNEAGDVGLAVMNPTGLFFHPIQHENGPCPHLEDEHKGGSWHWPEIIG